MNSPRPITTPIRRLNPLALGTKEQRDQFASTQLAREKEYQDAMKDLPEPPPWTSAQLDELERATNRKRHIGTPHEI